MSDEIRINGTALAVASLPEIDLDMLCRLKRDGLRLKDAEDDPEVTAKLVWYAVQRIVPDAREEDVRRIPLRLLKSITGQIIGGSVESDFSTTVGPSPAPSGGPQQMSGV